MKFGWRKFIPFLIFSIFFSVYIISACRTNSGYADSDEIVTAGYLLSVAHPPGYPLQIILTKLFTLLPIGGSVAFRANLMSGFFSALTLLFVYLVGVIVMNMEVGPTLSDFSHKIRRAQDDKLDLNSLSSLSIKEVIKEIVCITGVMVLGFSSQFWLYSSVAEVFALNNFLVILGIWMGLRWNWSHSQFYSLQARTYAHKHGVTRHDKLDLKSVSSLSRNEIKYFVLTCVVIGIGLSHVQTYVLMLPGFAVLFISSVWKNVKRDPSMPDFSQKNQATQDDKIGIKSLPILSNKDKQCWFVFRRVFLGIVLVFGSFVLINLSLFWLNSREQNFSWYFPQNLKGLYQEVTRWVYTDYDLRSGETASAYFGKFDLGRYIKTIPMYFGFLNEHFSYIGLVLGMMGIYYFWKFLNRKLFWVFGVWFLFGGLLMGIYSGYHEKRPEYLFYDSNVGMMQRQYLQGEVVWGVFVMCGLWYLLTSIQYSVFSIQEKRKNQNLKIKNKNCNSKFKTLREEKRRRGEIWVQIAFCSVLVGWMVFSNYKIGVQRNTTIAYDYAKTVLSSAEKDSVIICLYDFPCFSLVYMQEVENYRKDVIVIPRNRFFKYYFFEKNPQYYAYNYLDHKDYSSALVYWNLQNKKTYLTNLMPNDFNFAMYDGTFFVIPHGYLFEVRKDIPEEIYEEDYNLTNNFLTVKKDKRNYSLNGIEDLISSIHHILAQQYAYLGNQDKAMENIFLAQKLNKDFVQNKNLVSKIAIITKNPLYEIGNKTFGAEEFIKYAREKEKIGEITLALANYQRATFVEPRNKEARLSLAQFYLKNGMIRQGFEEYRRLNLMFPEDKEIEKVLEELRTRLRIR